MFYVPPTKKSFSLSALRCWGERLASEPNVLWETFLVNGFLEAGQALYRKISHPVEIFLEDNAAAVQFRTEEDGDIHIFFSADEKGWLHWRSSLPEREVAAPFAGAAMYFIEEFVAEEFPRLPVESGIAAESSPVPAPETPPPPVDVEDGPERTLIPVFSAEATRLSCAAFWEIETSGERIPALGKNAPSPDSLRKKDREQLIRLATLARRAYFSYDSENACYALHGYSQIAAFANAHLDKWRERFRLENVALVETFRSEPRELETEAVLCSESADAFSLFWNFEIDGERLSPEESRIVMRHADESVFLPGRGVVRIRRRAQKFISDWPDAATHGMPIYTLLSLFRNENSLKLSPDKKLLAWRKKFLAEPKAPTGMPDFLRPYQVRGVAWMRQMFDRGAHPLVADEMGLGKTLQVLSLLALDTRKRSTALIVCPASVVPVWQNEIRKFFPQLSYTVLNSEKKLSSRERPRITLTSYGLLRRSEAKIARKQFTYAILDEAQFIKNPHTLIARACLKINATHRLALTGTPIENRHLDLWTIFRFLMPGLLGRRHDLETALADSENNPESLEKLKTQIAPFILRRTKREVAKELPEKTQNVLFCPMLDLQREHYRAIVQSGLNAQRNAAGNRVSAQAAMRESPTNLLTLLMRLRQAACDPALLPGCAELSHEHSGKISALLERAQEIIDNGGKMVVFSQFVMLLERVQSALRERFPETPQFMLTGKTLDRETPVQAFQTTNGPAIFLVSLRAGGTGLTLHSAEYVFLLDPWWNPAVEEQAIDRVHRIGQQKRVFVYRMVSAGTVEERIEKLKQQKRELFNALVGGIPDMSDWAQHFPSLESLIELSE